MFFIDYGTTTTINISDTRKKDDEEVWTIPPLAVPFVVKDITLSQLNKFKKLQYSEFQIKSLKLIEKVFIFFFILNSSNQLKLIFFSRVVYLKSSWPMRMENRCLISYEFPNRNTTLTWVSAIFDFSFVHPFFVVQFYSLKNTRRWTRLSRISLLFKVKFK